MHVKVIVLIISIIITFFHKFHMKIHHITQNLREGKKIDIYLDFKYKLTAGYLDVEVIPQ